MAAPCDTLLAMFVANAHQWGRSAMAGGRHGRREGWGHDRSAKAGGITALWSHCSGVTTMLYCAIRFCSATRMVLSRHVVIFLNWRDELSRLRVIAQTCELRIARDVLAYSYKDFATKSATEIAILPYPLAFILLDAQSAST